MKSHRSGSDFQEFGLIVKTASEMKNLKSKIEMAKFAFTTYEKNIE